ncbi:uncharacterized protein LOC110728504 [Chenopodium quinoa]|uniref:Uncharacterized protein n=1 Tax=Chenopodium quinoa TaxID=63459 RepID=A0A803L2I8_CHEQI|nr:uncharacterized protein LOC110728504 [Chenopodium quinoa]
MAQRFRVLVPIFAFVLGILAVVFSFLAYAKRIKAEEVGPKVNGACVYPHTGACALGITAAALLLAEQTLISAAFNCFCCCGVRISSTCSAITSIILFVISWITFVIAFMGLLYTAIHNNISYLAKIQSEDNNHICKVGKEDVFLGATIWCIITIVLGLISYAFWAYGAANNTNNNYASSSNYKQGVAMGRPHTQLSKEQY